MAERAPKALWGISNCLDATTLTLFWFWSAKLSFFCCWNESGHQPAREGERETVWWRSSEPWMRKIKHYILIISRWLHSTAQINNHQTLNRWFIVEREQKQTLLVSFSLSAFFLFIHSLPPTNAVVKTTHLCFLWCWHLNLMTTVCLRNNNQWVSNKSLLVCLGL